MHKPTISMRKYDETQFVNVRTYWSLHYALRAGGSHRPATHLPTYELQVRHNAIEDSRVFLSHDAAERDALELLTRRDYDQRLFMTRQHEDMTPEAAVEALRGKVAVMDAHEARIHEHLTRTWEAFCLLFEPAYNL